MAKSKTAVKEPFLLPCSRCRSTHATFQQQLVSERLSSSPSRRRENFLLLLALRPLRVQTALWVPSHASCAAQTAPLCRSSCFTLTGAACLGNSQNKTHCGAGVHEGGRTWRRARHETDDFNNNKKREVRDDGVCNSEAPRDNDEVQRSTHLDRWVDQPYASTPRRRRKPATAAEAGIDQVVRLATTAELPKHASYEPKEPPTSCCH